METEVKLTLKSNLGSTGRCRVEMNNIPVQMANTDREFARITLAREVRLFILASGDVVI